MSVKLKISWGGGSSYFIMITCITHMYAKMNTCITHMYAKMNKTNDQLKAKNKS